MKGKGEDVGKEDRGGKGLYRVCIRGLPGDSQKGKTTQQDKPVDGEVQYTTRVVLLP